MEEKQVGFVTGAGRGLGADIVKAALAAGHAVIATGRDERKVAAVFGEHDDLFTVALDVTDPSSAEAAVQAGVERFGRVDVVVNNAANSTPASSKNSPPRSSAARSKPPSSAR